MTPAAVGRDFRGMLARGFPRPDLEELSARLHDLHELKRESPAVPPAAA